MALARQRMDQQVGSIKCLSASDSRLIIATQHFSDPHKVVCALLENSLDADATEISIVLEKVGLLRIVVSDNGCGIPLEVLKELGKQQITTAEMSSGPNIHKGESLFLISSLGTVRIDTSEGSNPYECEVNTIDATPYHSTRSTQGTTITVTDLYKPVPVRQRYYSSSSLRRKLINSTIDMLQAYALAKYTVGFRLIIDGTTYLSTPASANGTIHDRYIALFGHELSTLFGLFSLETRLGYSVKASLARPEAGFSKQTKHISSRKLFLSANGRPILCTPIVEALQQAYSRVSATCVPVGALDLALPLGSYGLSRNTPYDTLQMQGLDIFASLLQEEYLSWLLRYDNPIALCEPKEVHPKPMLQKEFHRPVRSTPRSPAVQPSSAHVSILRTSCKRSAIFFYLTTGEPQFTKANKQGRNTDSYEEAKREVPTLGICSCTENIEKDEEIKDRDNYYNPSSESTVRITAVSKRGEARGFKSSDFARLKYICQYNCSFLITQLDNVFFLVDQHAAHEARKFSEYWHNPHRYLLKQKSIVPIKLDLQPDEQLCINEFSTGALFDTIGFELKVSDGVVFLTGSPSVLGYTLTEADFREYLTLLYEHTKEHIEQLLQSNTGKQSREENLSRILHHNIAPPRIRKIFAFKSCKASVRLGDPLKESSAERILEDLADCEQPFNCPHGRPVLRVLNINPQSVTNSASPDESQYEFIESGE